MNAERPTPEEVIPAEDNPAETVRTSVEEILETADWIWSDRKAVDHFGFIPEGVTVRHRNPNRFPAWKEIRE